MFGNRQHRPRGKLAQYPSKHAKRAAKEHNGFLQHSIINIQHIDAHFRGIQSSSLRLLMWPCFLYKLFRRECRKLILCLGQSATNTFSAGQHGIKYPTPY